VGLVRTERPNAPPVRGKRQPILASPFSLNGIVFLSSQVFLRFLVFVLHAFLSAVRLLLSSFRYRANAMEMQQQAAATAAAAAAAAAGGPVGAGKGPSKKKKAEAAARAEAAAAASPAPAVPCLSELAEARR
jgi:hypothetical protein